MKLHKSRLFVHLSISLLQTDNQVKPDRNLNFLHFQTRLYSPSSITLKKECIASPNTNDVSLLHSYLRIIREKLSCLAER